MTQPPGDGTPARPGDRARRLAQEAREQEITERRAISGRVDELDRRVRALGAELERRRNAPTGDSSGTDGDGLDVAAHLAALSARVKALEGSGLGELRQPFDWDDLTDDERTETMEALTTWVRDVLVGRYRSRLGRYGLPDGWADDPLLRDIVTAAWLAWLYAYKNPGARLTEQWQWHRDVLSQLGQLLQDAAIAGRDRAGTAGR